MTAAGFVVLQLGVAVEEVVETDADRAPTWGELASLLEPTVTVLVAAVGAVWALRKSCAQRAKDRQETAATAEKELEARRAADQSRARLEEARLRGRVGFRDQVVVGANDSWRQASFDSES